MRAGLEIRMEPEHNKFDQNDCPELENSVDEIALDQQDDKLQELDAITNNEQSTSEGIKFSDESVQSISKKRKKKLLKYEAKKERWAEIRKKERESKKEKRALMKERGEEPPKKRKVFSMSASECKLRIVIDLSWEKVMRETEIRGTALQLQHCYSSNRQTENPVQLYLTSLKGEIANRLFTKQNAGNWDVHFDESHFKDIFPQKDIIYLTSESPNVLTEVDDSKVYVIGGILDHNRMKGVTLKSALEIGVSHAHLPITEYMDLKGRKVLTINQVFDILLEYSKHKDWSAAFKLAVPTRKTGNSE